MQRLSLRRLFFRGDYSSQQGGIVDSRRRLRICRYLLLLLFTIVAVRSIQLEISQGQSFRAAAANPLERRSSAPGPRGRILSADGVVLAEDRTVNSIAIAYRYLQKPLEADWLRRRARERLDSKHRNDPAALAAEIETLRGEIDERLDRLAELSDRAPATVRLRAERIAARVKRIHESVSRRHGKETTVAEERADHAIIDNVSDEIARMIEANPDDWPGVSIIHPVERVYPRGDSAANLVGYLGRVGPEEVDSADASSNSLRAYHPEDFIGRTGIEKEVESVLRGTRGVRCVLTDHSGQQLSESYRPAPVPGMDVRLTIDSQLQFEAEQLLDAALQRCRVHQDAEHPESLGGAVIAMSVDNGAIRAAATAPRFDPAAMARGEPIDPTGSPLLDRVRQAELPPGSVMKLVTAAALIESDKEFRPYDTFHCRGYLESPDRRRCAIFSAQGVGHGDITLADALAESCNVYFFDHIRRLDRTELILWAHNFGLGEETGVDLPAESRGRLPMAMTESDQLNLAIGQGGLTTTPLQIARLTATIATGRMPTPHVIARIGSTDRLPPNPRPVESLHPLTLELINEGMRRAVSDPRGTAHQTVYLGEPAIAAKTGTAQAGPGRGDHSWLAAYVPANAPRWAIVVVLEHGGEASLAAGPVVRRLIQSLYEMDDKEVDVTGQENPTGDSR